MVRPTAARRPPGRRTEAAAAPAMQLATPATPWLRNAILCLAAGIAAAGTGALLGHPVAGRAALVVSVPLAAAVGVCGKRRQLRREVSDRLLQALAPQLGLPSLDRRAVALTRWGRGWPGIPDRIELHYAPGQDDTDPQWRSDLAAAATRRLLQRYEVDRIDHQRCRLRLRLAGPVVEQASAPAVQLRAERVIGELIGPTATITRAEFTDGALVLIEGRHSAGAKLAASGHRARVERVVSTVLPGRWRAHWDLENDVFCFEVRPSFPASIWLPVKDVDAQRDLLAAYDDVTLSYGEDEDGEVMLWRPAHDPNLILVGAPGTGKTVTAHTLLVQATRHGWPVWVVDGKSIEFLGFQNWPNVQIVGTRIEQQVAIIHRAWEVMERRYELITSGRARESDFEPLLVFLDEFADFRGNLLAWYAEIKVKGDPTAPLVLSRVASLARKGRTSRVNLIFGTQRPDASYFGSGASGQSSDMRDNFRMRISMGRLSPQGAMMMWESPVIGTSIPRGCRGRATTINDANHAVEIQTYRTPDPRKVIAGSEEAALLDRLRPSVVGHERLLILSPEVQTGLDTGEVTEPTYADYADAPWVLASQRPDLDPVLLRQGEAHDGRALSSPMAVFGLADQAKPAAAQQLPQPISPLTAPRLSFAPAPRSSLVPHPGNTDVPSGADDYSDGYGPPVLLPVADLTVGDLVLVNDNDTWGTVDAEPEPDVDGSGCLAVSWRDDDDDTGVLSVPEDLILTARRPAEPVQVR